MIKLPKIGFGTWQMKGREATDATLSALESGYRLVDTAKIYGNEREVGEALRQSKVLRKELFITTKLWNSDQGYESALAAFDESLEQLGLDYIDLYLIHWPGHDSKRRLDSWKALEKLHTEKKARSIGVSNFAPEHLNKLAEHSSITPSVNQIEFHPFFYDEQKPTLAYCRSNGIAVEAYSPLARARDMNHPIISEIAKIHGKSSAQVMLRWALQHGTIPIPKSMHPQRIKENIDVFNFELSDKQMAAIDQLSGGKSSLPFLAKLLK